MNSEQKMQDWRFKRFNRVKSGLPLFIKDLKQMWKILCFEKVQTYRSLSFGSLSFGEGDGG